MQDRVLLLQRWRYRSLRRLPLRLSLPLKQLSQRFLRDPQLLPVPSLLHQQLPPCPLLQLLPLPPLPGVIFPCVQRSSTTI